MQFPDSVSAAEVAAELIRDEQEGPRFRAAEGAVGETTPSGSARGPSEWERPIPFYEFELPIFPTDALPGWLRAFVEGEALATQTPVDLAAMLCLSACGASLAKKVVVCVREGFMEPVNLFTVTSLPPGNRKSAVFAEVTAPIEECERAEIEAQEAEIVEAQTRYRIAEAALRKTEKDAANAKLEEREALTQRATEFAQELAALRVPERPRYIADDCTPERLATLLRNHGGRMAVLSAEGDVFDLMAGKYSNDGRPNLGVFLKGHAGDTIRVDRVGRAPEHVEFPALTLGLAVQPEVIRGLSGSPQFRGRGLSARFLYALPRSLLGSRDPKAPPLAAEVRANYRKSVRSLLALPFAADETGKLVARVLRLDGPARERLEEFETWLEPELGEFGELGHMTDWGGKLVGAVARITGILHMAERVGDPEPWKDLIGVETVERAVRIGQFLIPHARAAYAEMGADPAVEHARHLLSWIRRSSVTEFTQRQAFEATKGRFKRVGPLVQALGLLVEHNFIRQQANEGRQGAGRKPSPLYESNPYLASHNSQNSQNPSLAPSSANSANCATPDAEDTRTEDPPQGFRP